MKKKKLKRELKWYRVFWNDSVIETDAWRKVAIEYATDLAWANFLSKYHDIKQARKAAKKAGNYA